jgi:predicted MPP superfamily phosphohydrolase
MDQTASASARNHTSPSPNERPRTRQRWLALALPLTLIASLHGALWALLAAGSAPGTPFAIGLGVYLALSTLAIPAGFLSLRTRNPRWGALLSWLGLLALGLFSSLFVLALLRAALLPAFGWLGVPLLGWRDASAWAVVALAGLVTAGGLVVARMSPAVVRVDIAIDDLPDGLHGFRIAQITDIHVGPTIRRGYLQRIVDKVNALQADLVAITGDVVDGDVPTLQSHVAPLQHLKAREGVALVLGNHELYSGAQPWVIEFRRLGLQVLLNEHFIVRRNDATLAVAGVTDHTTGRFFADLASDPHAAIRGPGESADVRLLLAHQPLSAPAGAEAGFHLALHGHTHGGQWWPWNHFVRMQQPVVKGLHRFGRMWSYTSVGTGYWGPPKRHFRSEITLITLHPSAPSRNTASLFA